MPEKIVNFLEVKLDLWQNTTLWRGLGYWELPETTAESLAYHRVIGSALHRSMANARLQLDRLNWTLTVTVKAFRGAKAQKMSAINAQYSLDDPGRVDWIPLRHGKQPVGGGNGEG